jgi:hypothetical protein
MKQMFLNIWCKRQVNINFDITVKKSLPKESFICNS